MSLLGDDLNLGTSETDPWQTIERVNAAQLLPGDSVLFHANQTFLGNLCLQSSRHTPCAVAKDRSHTPDAVTIASYGFGRATIDAREGTGCLLKNRGGVYLRELNFVGAGAPENTDSGLLFINTLPGGIHLWSTGASGGITDTTFYANTIFTTHSADGNPAAVDCASAGIHNIRFYNNCFQTDGKAVFIRGKTNPNALFDGNTFGTDCRLPRISIRKS